MTFGRSVYKALAHFGIDRATWPVLAANRATWREAIHGSQLALTAGRPTRVAAAATNLRIGATLADARAGVWDIGASITHSFARAALAPAPAPPPPLPPPPPPPPPLRPPPPRAPVRRSARIANLPPTRTGGIYIGGRQPFGDLTNLPASLS